MNEPVAVKFIAEIKQTKNMSDHSYNIILNLPEYHGEEASWFLKHQLDLVDVVVVLKSKDEL